MRTTVLAVAAMLAISPLQAGAQDAGTADLGDFEVNTAQDLLDLCAVDPTSSLHPEALQFCYGFFEGMIHYHDRLVGPEIRPIVCPTGTVTRRDVVEMYIDFAQANPQFMDEDPADNVMRAAIAEWPCS
ncbi:MAG TPA: Rap1a/Tai family immunity protein [Geminicoccaceae bacterium]|nr:Rap1a/Tai family immunity protein [Geminicoccaceae bacterium]